MSPKIENVGIQIIKAKSGQSKEIDEVLFDDMTPDELITVTAFAMVCPNLCKDFIYGVYFGYTLAKESAEVNQLEKMMEEGK